MAINYINAIGAFLHKISLLIQKFLRRLKNADIFPHLRIFNRKTIKMPYAPSLPL